VVARENGAAPGQSSPRGQLAETKDARAPAPSAPATEASRGLRSAGLTRLVRRI
jgi:hypothetical protein